MSITVTAAESGSTFNGILLRVKVLTGAAASQAGAATAVFAGTGPQEASITTTVTGSQVYGALKTSSVTTLTAAAGTTLLDNFVDSPNTELLGTCRTTSATGSPGATTVGASAPSVGGQTALLEILPSGTITEDGSSPAVATATGATTVTTAAFTPPPGSLLVAIAVADANGSTVVTVSGGGLVWTQQVHSLAGGSATGYSGVWTATMPAVAAPPASVPAAPGPVWLRRFRHRQQSPPAPPLTIIGTASLAGAGAVSSGKPAFPAIPGVARPGQFTPGNPGGSAMVFPAPPPALFLSQRAQPGGTWLRRFRHRQAPLPVTAAGAVTSTGAANLAGAGSVTALATVITGATAAGSSAVTTAVTQIAPATAAGAGSVNGLVTLPGGGTITGSGAVGTAVTQRVIATAAGAGTVTDAVTEIAGATAAGAAAVTDVVTEIPTAGLTAAASVTDAVTQIVIASLAGAGAVTANVAGGASTANLTAAGSVSALATVAATATAAAAGTVTAKGAQAVTASPAGAGAVTTATAQRVTAALGAAGSVTAAGGAVAPFTVGTLTASTAPGATLTASDAPGGTSAGRLTASDTRTGGPS